MSNAPGGLHNSLPSESYVFPYQKLQPLGARVRRLTLKTDEYVTGTVLRVSADETRLGRLGELG